MKQILQNARTGSLELVEVPVPSPANGQVLVRSAYSVVSPGTEKSALAFARMSLVSKARMRPDLVKQVTRKLRQEGPLPTYRTVMTRLDAPQPLGYSSSGIVESVGPGVVDFAPGDRVACAGAGYASHAEFITVPENLCAKVPDGVGLDEACFSTLGAIAMQGVRVAVPTLGEIAAVVGLGLIGQITVQLLRASGCRVLGLDVDPARVKDAKAQGAEWAFPVGDLPQTWSDDATGGHGVDLVVVTASSENSAPLANAAELCRHKGRISLVGNMPIELDRRVFYEKELELRMSTSYGPGRYDRIYEESGYDYPLPYVRWTENRNLQAFLHLIASGAVTPAALKPENVPFEDAVRLYEDLSSGSLTTLAPIFDYKSDVEIERTMTIRAPQAAKPMNEIGISFIGAGNYAKGILLPAMTDQKNTRLVSLVASTGASASHSAEKFKFAKCGTDVKEVFADSDVDIVFVTTRHNTHAPLTIEALLAGKAVWLEKPIGLSVEEVDQVAEVVCNRNGFLTVGYNRRFSAHARAIRSTFENRNGPLAIRYTVAAGPPPRDSWVTDPKEGGGRIIGEMCHFVDLCSYLVGSPPSSVYARALGRHPELDDSVVAILGFPDGSSATIEYLARTDPDLPKERFEVSADDRSASCDNYKTTRITGEKDLKTFNQDKGQAAAIAEVIEAVRNGRPSPFTIFELVGVAKATFATVESIATGSEIRIGP